MRLGLHMPYKVMTKYLPLKPPGMAVGGCGCPEGVKQRAEHVVRERGEGLMGVELVADQKCCADVLQN